MGQSHSHDVLPTYTTEPAWYILLTSLILLTAHNLPISVLTCKDRRATLLHLYSKHDSCCKTLGGCKHVAGLHSSSRMHKHHLQQQSTPEGDGPHSCRRSAVHTLNPNCYSPAIKLLSHHGRMRSSTHQPPQKHAPLLHTSTISGQTSTVIIIKPTSHFASSVHNFNPIYVNCHHTCSAAKQPQTCIVTTFLRALRQLLNTPVSRTASH